MKLLGSGENSQLVDISRLQQKIVQLRTGMACFRRIQCNHAPQSYYKSVCTTIPIKNIIFDFQKLFLCYNTDCPI